MLFNSIDFALFLPLVFLIYWSLNRFQLTIQNSFLVVVSYIFYGWWDWRFLSLIFISSLLDFLFGLKIENILAKYKKIWLFVSVFINLGMLAFFKYFNFFIDNFNHAFTFFGTSVQMSSLNIILPVGISFYTFQTMSYSLDAYYQKLKPTNNLISFLAYVSFFPQLVAGPIERASKFLPQFYIKKIFDYPMAVLGLRQILWGLFKKIVIADNCSYFVNMFYNNPSDYSGSALALGAFFFSFQIYGDFSGYSDIAIGSAKLFGFKLSQNFHFPYFSKNISEFWKRWHISLSTWFRDYVYLPLGGSRLGKVLTLRNILIVFVLSGFWHGANWTFITWGFLNALLFIPLFFYKKNNEKASSKYSIFKIIFTFILVTILWIFFRAINVTQAIEYLNIIFSKSIFSIPQFHGKLKAFSTIMMIVILLILEWKSSNQQFALETMSLSKLKRWGIYIFIGILIFTFGNFNKSEFIYFAF